MQIISIIFKFQVIIFRHSVQFSSVAVINQWSGLCLMEGSSPSKAMMFYHLVGLHPVYLAKIPSDHAVPPILP